MRQESIDQCLLWKRVLLIFCTPLYKEQKEAGLCPYCFCIGHWPDECKQPEDGLETGDLQPCSVCGSWNHSRFECTFEHYTCTSCKQKGHRNTMCQSVHPNCLMNKQVMSLARKYAWVFPWFYRDGVMPQEEIDKAVEEKALDKCKKDFEPYLSWFNVKTVEDLVKSLL